MPDKTGTLSNTEQDKIIEWLSEIQPLPCSLCRGKEGLTVGKQLVAPVPINSKAQAVSVPTYPLVTLTCRKCQHVSFLNVKGVI